jgi:hypothetical protein
MRPFRVIDIKSTSQHAKTHSVLQHKRRDPLTHTCNSRTQSHTVAHSRIHSHSTLYIFTIPTMDEVDRRFTEGLSAACELYQQDKNEECVEALRKMLSDPAIPRYHRMRCLTLLGGNLGDWVEAYSCYVKCFDLWRITKGWYRDSEDPAGNKTLVDLHEGLKEPKYVNFIWYVRHALITYHQASFA